MPYPDRYLLFIEYFNKGKYQSAQTTLDEIWLDEEGADKDFFGGLIQAAVSLFHLTNENPKGAQKVFENTKKMLDKYGEQSHGLAVGKLVRELDELFSKHVDFNNVQADYRGVLPRIEFKDDSSPSS
jgi:predicted metal-dependent hydrolase